MSQLHSFHFPLLKKQNYMLIKTMTKVYRNMHFSMLLQSESKILFVRSSLTFELERRLCEVRFCFVRLFNEYFYVNHFSQYCTKHIVIITELLKYW